MKKTPKGKYILYTYISAANMRYLQRMKRDNDIAVSVFMDEMLDVLRTGKGEKVTDIKMPYVLKRLLKYRQRRQEVIDTYYARQAG